MRVLIGNKIIEFDKATRPGGCDDHVYLRRASDNVTYVVDCRDEELARRFMEQLLKYGIANLGNFNGYKLDYSNNSEWR